MHSYFTYNLAVQYRAASGLFGRIELQGLGTTFFDDANTLKQGSFALLNARLGYELDNYGIYFFANNITGVENIASAGDFSALGIGTIVSYGAPTTFGVQLRARI
jgi:iron complex outermembrane receptor protein